MAHRPRHTRQSASMSSTDWKNLQPTIIDWAKNGWRIEAMTQELRNQGYAASKKGMGNHLRNWGFKTYKSGRESEQLLDLLRNGEPLPPLSAAEIGKLKKYCKRKSYTDLLQKLSRLQAAETSSSGEDESTVLSGEQNADGQEQWNVVYGDAYDSDVYPEPELRGDHSTWEASDDSATGQVDQDVDGIEEILRTNTLSDSSSLVWQPIYFSDGDRNHGELLRLGQDYFNSKMLEHVRLLSQGSAGSVSEDLDILSTNTVFWQHIRNGIYYLKVEKTLKNTSLARRELTAANQYIPILSKQQPFTLLKDLFATMSPIATKVQPELRTRILSAFRLYAHMHLGSGDILTRLLDKLCADEGSDELSIVGLNAMLDGCVKTLEPRFRSHVELYELRLTMVQFYRRIENYPEAEKRAKELIDICENHTMFGPHHAKTRFAMSEYVYILKYLGDYELAMALAEEVLDRAKKALGANYPDDWSVYAMEDVAELCELRGDLDGSMLWLNEALRHAIRVLGHCNATQHIQDKVIKLVDTQKKKYELALKSSIVLSPEYMSNLSL